MFYEVEWLKEMEESGLLSEVWIILNFQHPF